MVASGKLRRVQAFLNTPTAITQRRRRRIIPIRDRRPSEAHPFAYELARRLAPSATARVLLLGVGTGRNIPPFADAGIGVFAVEDDAARARCATQTFAHAGRVRIVCAAYDAPLVFRRHVRGRADDACAAARHVVRDPGGDRRQCAALLTSAARSLRRRVDRRSALRLRNPNRRECIRADRRSRSGDRSHVFRRGRRAQALCRLRA